MPGGTLPFGAGLPFELGVAAGEPRAEAVALGAPSDGVPVVPVGEGVADPPATSVGDADGLGGCWPKQPGHTLSATRKSAARPPTTIPPARNHSIRDQRPGPVGDAGGGGGGGPTG